MRDFRPPLDMCSCLRKYSFNLPCSHSPRHSCTSYKQRERGNEGWQIFFFLRYRTPRALFRNWETRKGEISDRVFWWSSTYTTRRDRKGRFCRYTRNPCAILFIFDLVNSPWDFTQVKFFGQSIRAYITLNHGINASFYKDISCEKGILYEAF